MSILQEEPMFRFSWFFPDALYAMFLIFLKLNMVFIHKTNRHNEQVSIPLGLIQPNKTSIGG